MTGQVKTIGTKRLFEVSSLCLRVRSQVSLPFHDRVIRPETVFCKSAVPHSLSRRVLIELPVRDSRSQRGLVFDALVLARHVSVKRFGAAFVWFPV